MTLPPLLRFNGVGDEGLDVFVQPHFVAAVLQLPEGTQIVLAGGGSVLVTEKASKVVERVEGGLKLTTS